jgi:hypothetical protein
MGLVETSVTAAAFWESPKARESRKNFPPEGNFFLTLQELRLFGAVKMHEIAVPTCVTMPQNDRIITV